MSDPEDVPNKDKILYISRPVVPQVTVDEIKGINPGLAVRFDRVRKVGKSMDKEHWKKKRTHMMTWMPFVPNETILIPSDSYSLS